MLRLFIGMLVCGIPLLATAARQPNILWILAEDIGPELGCYGTKQVHTPHLDQLADQGMLFRNAFTVTPVCSTSRSSFMTGMYAMSIDAQNHRSHREGTNPLPNGVRVLTDWFRDAGYSTANITQLTDDITKKQFYRGTGKTDWNFTYDKNKRPFDLNKWSQLKNNQPFYAQVNFPETHRGRSWNQAHQHIPQIADPAKVEIPPYYPDHAVTRAVWAQYLNAIMALDDKVGFVLELLQQDGLADNTVVVFMGDHGRAMPRGKQWPYDSGMHVPLIIFWPPNNPQLPMPAGYEAGLVSNDLIASIDVSATSLAMAGIETPPKMQGQPFLGPHRASPRDYLFGGRDRGDETVLHIRTVRDKQYRYLLNRYPERPFLQLNRYKEASYPILGLLRSLDSKGQLEGPPTALMARQRPTEELYDLRADPWEINNLADSPQHTKTKNRLKAQLVNWMEQIDDQGREPEDPAIPAVWDQRMRDNYDKRLQSRPNNWFQSSPALGPYRN